MTKLDAAGRSPLSAAQYSDYDEVVEFLQVHPWQFDATMNSQTESPVCKCGSQMHFTHDMTVATAGRYNLQLKTNHLTC